MTPTPMSMRLRVCLTLLMTVAAVAAFAQTNEELYKSGQIGYAHGNCVKAARFFFAYLIRQPAELAADPARKARLEQVIRVCDETPERYASTLVIYAKKKPPKESQCEIYAELAVAQFEANQLASCNLTGSRWSSNRPYHYKWCVGVDELEASRERQARDVALNSCGAK